MSIEVRPALREELDRVNDLRRQVNDLHVQGRPDIFRPDFVPEMRDLVFEQFDSDRFDVLVALLDGEISGFATVQLIQRPESPYNLARSYYHVEEFGVDAAHRRKGVATALVDYMRADARARGFDRIELDAWAFNQDALSFYETAGFETYRYFMELPLTTV